MYCLHVPGLILRMGSDPGGSRTIWESVRSMPSSPGANPARLSHEKRLIFILVSFFRRIVFHYTGK